MAARLHAIRMHFELSVGNCVMIKERFTAILARNSYIMSDIATICKRIQLTYSPWCTWLVLTHQSVPATPYS
jgi:hypothetical protein